MNFTTSLSRFENNPGFFFLSKLYIVEASEAKSDNKVEAPNYEGKGGRMNLKLAK